MIKGKSVTNKRESVTDCRVSYRKIDALNVSSIKDFDKDPVLFYKRYILKHKGPDKKSVALIIGDLVDFYLLDCDGNDDKFVNRFDEKFALYQGKKGTGQVFLLADILFKITGESLNNLGEVVRPFEDRFKEAYEIITSDMPGMARYKGSSWESALEDFDSKGKDYFNTLMENSCKTVVEVSLVDKSKRVAEQLISDPFTSSVFSDDTMDYFPKFPVEWNYTCQNGKVIKCKSELDVFKIDHANKILYMKDVKTTHDNEEFIRSYMSFRYDLQAAFYYLAIKWWAEQEGLEGYEVRPMEFVVGDTSINNRRPVRYQTTYEDLDAGLNGFTIRGVRYKGIHELIEDIAWAEESGIWNASRELVENNGSLSLNLNYE